MIGSFEVGRPPLNLDHLRWENTSNLLLAAHIKGHERRKILFLFFFLFCFGFFFFFCLCVLTLTGKFILSCCQRLAKMSCIMDLITSRFSAFPSEDSHNQLLFLKTSTPLAYTDSPYQFYFSSESRLVHMLSEHRHFSGFLS